MAAVSKKQSAPPPIWPSTFRLRAAQLSLNSDLSAAWSSVVTVEVACNVQSQTTTTADFVLYNSVFVFSSLSFSCSFCCRFLHQSFGGYAAINKETPEALRARVTA